MLELSYIVKGDVMQKAILSRIDLQKADHEVAHEFLNCIQDILEIDDVMELKSYHQHFKTTRFQHCLNVAYHTFIICRYFHMDYVSATRAALVHDLYLYDWRKQEQPIAGRHSVVHPQVALQNAQLHIEVNDLMEDIILHHMWPISLKMPRHKEAWVVQGVDKVCALAEFTKQGLHSLVPRRLAVSLIACIMILARSY